MQSVIIDISKADKLLVRIIEKETGHRLPTLEEQIIDATSVIPNNKDSEVLRWNLWSAHMDLLADEHHELVYKKFWDNLHSDGVLLDTGAKLRIRDSRYVIDGYAHDGSDVSQIMDSIAKDFS